MGHPPMDISTVWSHVLNPEIAFGQKFITIDLFLKRLEIFLLKSLTF